MTEDEATAIARTAATQAVNEAFNRLGIDYVADWKEVQRDMSFIRNWRQSTDAIKRQGALAAIAVIVAGLLGLIWTTLRGP